MSKNSLLLLLVFYFGNPGVNGLPDTNIITSDDSNVSDRSITVSCFQMSMPVSNSLDATRFVVTKTDCFRYQGR